MTTEHNYKNAVPNKYEKPFFVYFITLLIFYCSAQIWGHVQIRAKSSNGCSKPNTHKW